MAIIIIILKKYILICTKRLAPWEWPPYCGGGGSPVVLGAVMLGVKSSW